MAGPSLALAAAMLERSEAEDASEDLVGKVLGDVEHVVGVDLNG